MPDVKFELTDHELEFLHQLHNAQAIKEMMEHPGWPLVQHLSQKIIGRMEDQHLEFAGNASRDAYWLAGARLKGARMYAKILMEEIAKEVGILKQDLVPPDGRLDLADLDGEMNV